MSQTPIVSRNGASPNGKSPTSAEKNGTTVNIADRLSERGRAAYEKCRNDPVKTNKKLKPPPKLELLRPAVPDMFADQRNLAQFIAALSHPSPERDAWFASLGALPDTLATRLCIEQSRALIAEVDAAQREGNSSEWLDKSARDEIPLVEGLNTRRLSEVTEEEVWWLWNQRIPRRKLTIISGDPDMGKTWIILDAMARVTTGQAMPDGAPNPFSGERRDVLWASDEDDDEDVITKRFRMLGGDMTRFHSVWRMNAPDKDEVKLEEQPFDLSQSKHLEYLDKWLAEHPLVAMVGLDPLLGFIGSIDARDTAGMRGLLSPLRNLAFKHGVAIVAANHLTKHGDKSALYRSQGNIALVAASRSAWIVTKDPGQPKARRLFLEVKGNLREDAPGGLAYRIGREYNGISWEQGRIETTADEALQSQQKDDRAPKLTEAKDFWRDLLKNGPVSAKAVYDAACAHGVSERTLQTASKELAIKPQKVDGKAGCWEWSLPSKDAS
jgi:hypothetical protein